MRQRSRTVRIRSVRALGILLTVSCLTSLGAACSDDGGEPAPAAEREDERIAALRQEGAADPSCRAETDGVLKLGGLLSQSGEFGAVLGAPQIAGANVAVADVNGAGGVLGQPIALTQLDPGESTDQAVPQAQAHLDGGVDAVIGASTSQISQAVIEPITRACRIMFSPANTAPEFTTVDDGDLYFRTAATDVLQGRVLANAAIEEGVTSAAIIARDDPYGEGLRTFIAEPFEDAGGEVVVSRSYNPDARDFTDQARAVVNRDPQALFLVGFAESAQVLLDLIEAGFTPETKRIYLVEGNMTTAFAQNVPTPGALAGIRGTIPGAPVSQEFRFRLLGQDGDLPNYTYGPEAYDAVTVVALAAEEAGTDRADEVARHINAVTRDGTKCTSFAQCKELLAGGQDIDYDGPSGPLAFARPGEPTSAQYGLYPWTAQNTIDLAAVQYFPVSL
jgi:ABC-type branched-subunit amino acid transport system substrate-binding protein